MRKLLLVAAAAVLWLLPAAARADAKLSAGATETTLTGTLIPLLHANVSNTTLSFNTSQFCIGSGALIVCGGGITNAMLAGSIDLTSKVTGLLPIANGGTGLGTFTAHGLFVGNGTGTPSFLLPGSNNNCAVSNGTDWTSAACQVSGANPTASAGIAVVNGSAATFMRSDAAPAVPAMTATVAGLVPTPPNDSSKFLNGIGTFTSPGGTSGGGMFGYSDNGLTLTANTRFVPIYGSGTPSTTEADFATKSPSATTATNLQVNLSSDPGAGQTLGVTLRDGGADTALTCTITGGGGAVCQDLTHSVNIAQNDLIDWKVVTTGTFVSTPSVTILANNGTSNVGITSVATTSPITGGTITTTGTIACATCVTSAASLTNHAPIIGGGSQGEAATAAMTNGQLLVGATGADPAPQSLSQDCTLTSGGVITCLKTNNVSFGTAATANTGTSGAAVPLLNGTNTFSGTQTFGAVLGTVSTQSGTTYTLSSTDCGTLVLFTNSGAITATVPNSLPTGCHIAMSQEGAGQVTVVAGASATFNANPHAYTKTFGQYAIIAISVKSNAGSAAVFTLMGDGA